MQFKTAYRLSQEVEHKLHSQLVVAGFRRQRFDVEDSWALDLVEPGSGRMVTLDEKDDWQGRLDDMLWESEHQQQDQTKRNA